MRKRSAAFGPLLAVTCLAALAAVGAAALAGSAAAQEPAASAAAGAPAAPQPPIHISADAAEYFNKEGRVVFSGNVVAVEGDTTLTSQRMEVTFSQPAGTGEGRPAGIGEPAAARKITEIVALERVTFRQVDPETKKERFATGEKGVYDAVQRVVTMTGSPRLWEGKNVIVGDEIRMRLDDKNMNVRGKVNLTVYPDDAKEAKQP